MNRPVYFMHIAKTGGGSLHHVFRNHFAPEEIAPVYLTHQLAALLKKNPRALDSYRFVHGHLGYAPVHHLTQEPCTLTMLRDPLERTLSHYEHIIRSPDHWLFQSGLSPRPSLEDFLRYEPARNLMTNFQVRNIAQDFDLGSPFKDKEGAPLLPLQGKLLANCLPQDDDDALLARATDRMQSFAWAGLTERFPESLKLLDRAMGWQLSSEERVLNTAPSSRVRKEDISREARDIIASCTALDQELYLFARARFEKALVA